METKEMADAEPQKDASFTGGFNNGLQNGVTPEKLAGQVPYLQNLAKTAEQLGITEQEFNKRHPDIIRDEQAAALNAVRGVKNTVWTTALSGIAAGATSLFARKKGWIVRSLVAGAAAIGGAVIGATAGFLVFNKPRAKDMGETAIRRIQALEQDVAEAQQAKAQGSAPSAPAPATEEKTETKFTAKMETPAESHTAQVAADAAKANETVMSH